MLQDSFSYTVEQFADLQILRYRVPGFENLPLRRKQLIYYLSQAALEGRDILFDQNGKYNLQIRRLLEAVYIHFKGDRTNEQFFALEVYLKRVWFANGIHHHYACDKFVPAFTSAYLEEVVNSLPEEVLPLEEGETCQAMCDKLFPVIFDPIGWGRPGAHFCCQLLRRGYSAGSRSLLCSPKESRRSGTGNVWYEQSSGKRKRTRVRTGMESWRNVLVCH